MSHITPGISADRGPWGGVFGRLDPIAHAFSPAAREQRVIVLLVAVLLMGLGDLYMTLTFITSVGMIENNPIARLVMAHGSSAAVVVWKLSLTLFGVGVLVWARRSRHAEIATWLVFMVMTGLTFHWLGFSSEAATIVEEYHHMAQSNDPKWVVIPSE